MDTLDNPYAEIGLRFRQGEPLSWTVTSAGSDWSGTYVAQIVSGGALVATLGVVAVYANPDTTLAITLSTATSATIPPGVYTWAARASTGEVRIRGSVTVDAEAVPVA